MSGPKSPEAFDPPETKPVPRIRPHVQGSIAPDVAAALHAEHERRGGFFGHTLEAVLRRGLGLEEPPRAA
jgi:hypothetical protein